LKCSLTFKQPAKSETTKLIVFFSTLTFPILKKFLIVFNILRLAGLFSATNLNVTHTAHPTLLFLLSVITTKKQPSPSAKPVRYEGFNPVL